MSDTLAFHIFIGPNLMHFPISIISKFPFFYIDKLLIISEILIYRLSNFFHRYIGHPYECAHKLDFSSSWDVGIVVQVLLAPGCSHSYQTLLFGLPLFTKHFRPHPSHQRVDVMCQQFPPPPNLQGKHHFGRSQFSPAHGFDLLM